VLLSINREGFAQVAGEVRVIAARDCHMVGKKLQRQHCKQEGKCGICFRQHDQVASIGPERIVSLFDGDRFSTSEIIPIEHTEELAG